MDYDHPTGLVYAKPNEHNEVVYDIVFPSAWDFIKWDKAYIDLVAQAEFFVYGSLTSRSKVSRETLYRFLEVAKIKVLDINLRPPHFNRPNVEYLLRKADILKVNKAELELITGWFSQFEKMEDRIAILQEQFNIKAIIVTMGANGSLVNYDGTVSRHPGFQVQVADTIGSGDAYLAGFLHQQLSGYSISQSLVYASALGALTASYPGGCPNYELSEIDAFMNNSSLTKIQTS
jgi:fructokinase